MVPVRFAAPDVMIFQVAANSRRINGQRKLGLVTVNFSCFCYPRRRPKNAMPNRRLYFGDLKRKMLRKKLLICAIYEDSLPLLIIIPIILRVALVRLLNHIQQRRHPHPSGTNAAPPPTDRP